MVVTRFMLLTFCFRSIFIIIIIFIKLFLRNDAFGAMLVVFFLSSCSVFWTFLLVVICQCFLCIDVFHCQVEKEDGKWQKNGVAIDAA